MVKRILALLMMIVLTLSLFSACGNSEAKKRAGTTLNIPDEFSTDTAVTIKFYHNMGQDLKAVLEEAIVDFNKIYPNIKIEQTKLGDYDTILSQISTEMISGNQPDLAYCYPDHVATYNSAGITQPLDELIASKYGFTEEDIANFHENFYKECSNFEDGKTYTLPIARSTEVLFYNKTFFEENNLTVPTTWEEMEAVCRQIKAIKPDCIPLGYDSEANWFITMCEQYGSPYTSTDGDKFLFNNETNVAFVKMFQGWYKDKLVTTKEIFGGNTSNMFRGADKKMTRCYMSIGSTGGARYQQPNQTNGVFDFEVGIAPIPQVDPANPKAISQGPSICLFKNEDTNRVMAAWLFAKFLATDEVFQGSYAMKNGYVPVIKSVNDFPAYASFLETASTQNIQAYATKVANENAASLFTSPVFFGSSTAREEVGKLMQKCLPAEVSDIDAFIQKAFDEAVSECRYQVGMRD